MSQAYPIPFLQASSAGPAKKSGPADARVLIFHRSPPTLTSPAEAADWLNQRGYSTSLRVFLGPDGSCRGSAAWEIPSRPSNHFSGSAGNEKAPR
jgi:hypothetical protein